MTSNSKVILPSLFAIVAVIGLSGCESSGSMRVASVGDRGPTGTAGPAGPQGPAGADGSNGADGTNGMDGANGAVGATGAAGVPGLIGLTGAIGLTGPAGPGGSQGAPGDTVLSALAVGGLVGPNGVAGTGLLANTGNPDATNPVVSSVLVAAGNTVQGVGGTGPGSLLQPVVQTVETALPGAAPLTGALTQTVQNVGQALVDTGNGSQYLVDGLTAAPGQLVNLTVGSSNVVGGASGQTPAVGLSVLSPTQSTGGLLSVGVASGGQLVTLQPGESAGPVGSAVGGVTGATSGLLNVTAGDNTVIGTPTQTAALGVGILSPEAPSGSLLGVGVGSGGEPLTVSLGSANNVADGPVGSIPSALGGGASPVNALVETVQNAVGTVTGDGSGSTATPLSGVTGAVGGVVSSLTGGASGGGTGALLGGVTAPASVGGTGLTGGLGGLFRR